jgi:hypothetical protein
MGKRRRPKVPLSLKFFERALEEEMSLSAEYDLPLTLLVVRVKGELEPEMTRRLLKALRTAELVTLLTTSELAVALQNTDLNGARTVERRLRKILPDAEISLATCEPDDEVSSLLERARGASGR